jgi:hypothetical protein
VAQQPEFQALQYNLAEERCHCILQLRATWQPASGAVGIAAIVVEALGFETSLSMLSFISLEHETLGGSLRCVVDGGSP